MSSVERIILSFLNAVYSDRPHISVFALRMKLAVTFCVTANDNAMFAFATLRPRPGLGRRLRTKTSPGAPVVVVVLHIRPYLDKIYEHISGNPNIAMQGLSDYFVAQYGTFFLTSNSFERRHPA